MLFSIRFIQSDSFLYLPLTTTTFWNRRSQILKFLYSWHFCILIVSSSFPPFMHRYSVFDLLTFIPLLSNAYLQDFNLRSTSSLVSLHITISSANSIVHYGSLLTSSVSMSITENRNGLNADPWCSETLTLKLSVVSTAHFTTVSLLSYISCTSCTYFSTILDFLIQYHSSSRRTLS